MADDSGDPDLLSGVQTAYERLVLSQMRGDQDEAMRVAQRTWPVALARLSRMARKLEGDPGEWLRTIAKDIAAAHVHGAPLGVTTDDMAAVKRFYYALHQLTEAQLEFALLRLRGMSLEGAAKRTRRCLEAAGALVRRARRRFRRAMEEMSANAQPPGSDPVHAVRRGMASQRGHARRRGAAGGEREKDSRPERDRRLAAAPAGRA